jgi:hypothetical protein
VDRAPWILNRVAAAVAGALLVGVAAGIILTAAHFITCGPTCTDVQFNGSGPMRCTAYGSTCGVFVGALLFNLIWAPIFSAALGVVPGFLALTVTPAKTFPWRSLPALVLGTLVGFAIWLPVAWNLNLGTIGWFATLFLIPSVTGLITAHNIRRLPPILRLSANSR